MDHSHHQMDHGEDAAPTPASSPATMHDMHEMKTDVTRPQLVAVSILSVLALVAGLIWSAMYANLRIGSHDVDGAIMPPGMIMTRDMPAEAMKDMAAVDPRDVSYVAPFDAQGAQVLEPTIEDGVKVFELELSVIEWSILPDETVMAYAINRQVPGPTIRVTEGDRIRMVVTNHLPESSTLHWHGLIVPNAMDGAAEITQDPIEPGQTFTYEFTTQQYGTYFYHSHDHIDRQQGLGLYGALIIDPKDPADVYNVDQELDVQLQEWLERDGYTYPAMPMEGAMPNYFTINGKAYPATQTVHLTVGDRLLVRFIGTNSNFIHPMHIHGGPFEVVAIDGNPVPEGNDQYLDTVNIAPGQRYDVIWTPTEPGKWLLHCHISHHTTNNNTETDGGGGLMLILDVAPADDATPVAA